MNCPVCKRREVGTSKCPQCDTDLTSLIILEESGTLSYNLGLRLAGKGNYSDAETHLLSSLAINPNDIDAMTLLAKVCILQGRLAESKTWWQKILKHDASNSKAGDAIRALDQRIRLQRLAKAGLVSIGAILLVAFGIYTLTLREQNLKMKDAIAEMQTTTSVLHDSLKVRRDPISEPSSFAYVVRRGDTLWKISRRFYGHGRFNSLILDANPIIRNKATSLSIGSVLTIPSQPSAR